MTPGRSRRWPWTVLVGAVVLLVASVAWTVGVAPGSRTVTDLDDARRAADRVAARWGLEAGEVMEFANGFYAELVEPSGRPATEVLVDARSGAVRIEFGPAMMWNTDYGMHRGGARTAAVGPAQAQQIADAWLRDNRPGESAAEPDAFPGYYTLHTVADGEVTGMLSVHAVTGEVWYHSWHGRFVAMAEEGDMP